MYCKHCGAKISDDSLFCLNCGEPQGDIKKEEVIIVDKPTENKAWGIFARMGYWFGVGSLIACLFFGIGGITGIYGIVFSALGKRSKIYREKADYGLVLNIIATIIGWILLVGCYVFYIVYLVYILEVYAV